MVAIRAHTIATALTMRDDHHATVSLLEAPLPTPGALRSGGHPIVSLTHSFRATTTVSFMAQSGLAIAKTWNAL